VPTNRLTVYQDLRFQYDLHGNIVERRIGWHTVQRFRYSAEHQMLESTVTRYHDRPGPKIAGSDAQQEPAATVQTTRYRYDALGRRIDKQDAFGRTTFLYDGDLLAGEIRGSRLSEYLYEPDSFVPLAKLESEWRNEEPRNAQAEADKASFATYYYHCDQIGAPQELTDEAGRIVWAASYKVWGQTQQLQYLRTGTDDAAVFTHDQRPLALAAQGDVQNLALVEQPLWFHGQYFDGETGLHYNRFRYYDPVVGRFVHQDPVGFGGGNNFYTYGPNSENWYDPLGLAKRPPHKLKATTKDVNGDVKSEKNYVSGGMTEEDKKLGYPLCSLVTHTERKALKDGEYLPTDSIEMHGEYAPCSHCKGAMNTAVDSGRVARILYYWKGKIWEAGAAARKMRNKKKRSAGMCSID
jgi:RHS repeat-associated protein